VVAVLLVGNPLKTGPTVPGGHTGTPTASPASSPIPSPTPYKCGASSAFFGTQPPQSAEISDVRTGTHAGYDRLTIEFKNGQPNSIEITPQTNTNFTNDPRGDTVKLVGQVGLRVVINTADAHIAYSGPKDIKTGYAGLMEVRQMGDYEGYVTYGLGLAKPGCYTATILTNPVRLVIDIQVS
jgi:hypothetical protein